MGRTEADPQITNEPWSSMQALKKTNKTTLRSEWRSVLKKSLTEPTLLEMSGNPTSMIGLCQEGKSSPDALRRSAGTNSFGSLAACVGLSAVVPVSVQPDFHLLSQ